jgi:hypothetical protein
MNLPTSPAADRNKGPILDQLRAYLPATGKVLEIASGTGQHVVHFAASLPYIAWQPTDPDVENLNAIAARRLATGLANIRAPLRLDVHNPEWGVAAEFDAVLCINMIHIAPWSATLALLAGTQHVLHADGARLLVLYGPYKEGGQHTAPSNEEFDASLRSRHPRWGVRDLEEVTASAAAAGFTPVTVARLPANNLVVAFRS